MTAPTGPFRNVGLSKAAQTHRLRKLRTPSKCRECNSYVYFQGAECEEVKLGEVGRDLGGWDGWRTRPRSRVTSAGRAQSCDSVCDVSHVSQSRSRRVGELFRRVSTDLLQTQPGAQTRRRAELWG